MSAPVIGGADAKLHRNLPYSFYINKLATTESVVQDIIQQLNELRKKARAGGYNELHRELETEIAKFITENVPNVDQIRMVSSGTEACMSAIRLARGFTGRDKFIKS